MHPAAPQTPVGADSISARGPRRIARLAGGACPSPTNHGKRPTKRDGLHHPGGRRAGCPHPAAPRGGNKAPFFEIANVRGRERPPYRAGQTQRPTGKMRPRRAATPVGDDARTAPAGAFRRPTGPQARLLGRRSSRGPCGGANARGRDKSLPYNHGRPAANRENAPRRAANLCRGRFHIGPGTPPHRKACGRGMPLPYKPWQTPNQTGWPQPSGRP